MPTTTTKPTEFGSAVKPPKPPALTFVTPEMASSWLESNTENRNIRQRQVDALARDITSDAWQITGDPVKFDSRGILIDGQHRLWAIVQSGKTVPLFVIRDLPTSVRDVIDTNVVRSAADVLRLKGDQGADLNALAACARIAMMRDAGGMQVATEWPPTWRYSNTEVVRYLEAHPEYAAMQPRAKGSAKAVGAQSRALWNYLLVQMDNVDHDASLEFETALVEMQTDGAGDPKATLLKWFRDMKTSQLTSRAIMPRTMFATFRSWNAWREGKSLTKIQINEGALIPEPI